MDLPLSRLGVSARERLRTMEPVALAETSGCKPLRSASGNGAPVSRAPATPSVQRGAVCLALCSAILVFAGSACSEQREQYRLDLADWGPLFFEGTGTGRSPPFSALGDHWQVCIDVLNSRFDSRDGEAGRSAELRVFDAETGSSHTSSSPFGLLWALDSETLCHPSSLLGHTEPEQVRPKPLLRGSYYVEVRADPDVSWVAWVGRGPGFPLRSGRAELPPPIATEPADKVLCSSEIAGGCICWDRANWDWRDCGALADERLSGDEPSRSGAGCLPSYPTVCLPAPPPDLDCQDLLVSSFPVVGTDPHRLDRDGDGIACEPRP
jgi:hypothetical protein